ncbi:hypothetical protein [Paremcibacter congregatus]|uniref:hypothetical protein n=1 Tax=Paremcibacter congregatus TaxID=2043170 RepID=UPI0030ECF162
MAGHVWDKTFEKVTVRLDGITFSNCSFIDCCFQFNGIGEAPSFNDCEFKNIKGIYFMQHAKQTMILFTKLGVDPSFSGLKDIKYHFEKPPKEYPVAMRLNS